MWNETVGRKDIGNGEICTPTWIKTKWGIQKKLAGLGSTQEKNIGGNLDTERSYTKRAMY